MSFTLWWKTQKQLSWRFQPAFVLHLCCCVYLLTVCLTARFGQPTRAPQARSRDFLSPRIIYTLCRWEGKKATNWAGIKANWLCLASSCPTAVWTLGNTIWPNSHQQRSSNEKWKCDSGSAGCGGPWLSCWALLTCSECSTRHFLDFFRASCCNISLLWLH